MALAVTLLVMALACGERNTYVPPPPPKVTVSHPVKRPVTDYLEFTGNAVALNTVQLVARVEGYLEKILFQDGESVKKGRLLFLIQQDQYKADLQKAKASVLAEKAQLEHAQTEYVRYAKLRKQQAAAQTDVDRWHYERDSRKAAVMAAEAQVELAKLNLSYTRVTAPFDGRMGRHLKDVGELVGAGTKTVLAEINQIAPIYVYFPINEQDLLRVRGKNPEPRGEVDEQQHPVFVGLADETGYPHTGYLDFAAISLNPTTGSLMLRGIFPNPKELILPGMFVRVRAPVGEKKEALLVPEAALSYDQLGPFLRVIGEKNIVERRGVKLGVQEDANRVILEGVHENDLIVVGGILRAIPGRPVTPEKTSAQPVPKGPQPANPQSRKTAP
ncbi:MAG: efflux RND transporter periplasmic adaptor subunit [Thermodesulfobacteriota bacterium]